MNNRKYRGRPRECPTIALNEEQQIVLRDKEYLVASETKKVSNREVMNSYKRRYRERRRMTMTPCTECVIMKTCQKRIDHCLNGCEYAIVQTSSGHKASCSASVARYRKGDSK